ncbi:MAG: hypothetical protein AAF518_16215 [Spirochaetota bacterium]
MTSYTYMPNKITYLNTDLDVKSSNDLTSFLAELENKEVSAIHSEKDKDGIWFCILETWQDFTEPEECIISLLDTIDSSSPKHKAIWENCLSREFNIGYECGKAPWGFQNALSPNTLKRLADANSSLKITIYPEDRELLKKN